MKHTVISVDGTPCTVVKGTHVLDVEEAIEAVRSGKFDNNEEGARDLVQFDEVEVFVSADEAEFSVSPFLTEGGYLVECLGVEEQKVPGRGTSWIVPARVLRHVQPGRNQTALGTVVQLVFSDWLLGFEGRRDHFLKCLGVSRPPAPEDVEGKRLIVRVALESTRQGRTILVSRFEPYTGPLTTSVALSTLERVSRIVRAEGRRPGEKVDEILRMLEAVGMFSEDGRPR